MARRDLRHPAGVDGPWFVDDRCIHCDAAWEVAPDLIARNPGDGASGFARQPETDDEGVMAWRALPVCPTRSVGHETIRQPPAGVFPHDTTSATTSTGSATTPSRRSGPTPTSWSVTERT